MTNNQLYAGLNRRFDKRAKLLLDKGFTYNSVEVARNCHITYFIKSKHGISKIITASIVMNCNKNVWIDELKYLLVR
jgi:hypothetical protein